MAAPTLFYTDLDSGPKTGGENNNGVYVTLFGKRFGASRGSSTVTFGGGAVASYVSWSDTKVVVQLGSSAATGNVVLTTSAGASNALTFTVRSGRIFFASASGTGDGSTKALAMSPASVYTTIAAGDTFYFSAGTYTGAWGDNWADANWNIGYNKTGTAGNPVAFSAYPGELVTWDGTARSGCWNLMDSNDDSPYYYTICNFTMHGLSFCFSGGTITPSYAEVYQSGTWYSRIINNVMVGYYGTANTMTGILGIGGVGNKIYGNELKDTGSGTPINNNHGMYIQVGASDIDVGWNYIHNMKMGHVIQVHTDTFFTYTNVKIHDNTIIGTDDDDCRGINIGNVNAASYGDIYNNVLATLGQNFSGIAVYGGGPWKIYNNTLYAIKAQTASSSGALYIINNAGQDTEVEIKNNIIWAEAATTYVYTDGTPTITWGNNLYYGNGSGPAADSNEVNADPVFVSSSDYHLQVTSPAIGAGTTSVNSVVTKDYDGLTRGAAFDIGAYEYEASSLLSGPTNLRWRPH